MILTLGRSHVKSGTARTSLVRDYDLRIASFHSIERLLIAPVDFINIECYRHYIYIGCYIYIYIYIRSIYIGCYRSMYIYMYI